VSTARSPRSAAWWTTPVATRFTRATGDADLRRALRRFPPPFLALLRRAPLRAEDRLLDFRAEDLRPPFRREEDLRAPRRDDLRAELRTRFRAAPLDLFLPPLERLDFLAAAIGKLRVGEFVKRIARFAHNY